MRQAICHYSFHRRYKAEGWDADRLAAEVKALGVEGVDFHTSLLGDPDAAPGAIKAALARHGLVLSGLSMGNDFNKSDPAEFRSQVNDVKRWLQVAAEVETPVSRIFGGDLKKDRHEDTDAAAAGRRRILDGIGEVVKEAERLGVVFALENHGGLPCTAEEQVEVIETINSPNLKATVDIGNYMQGGQESAVAVAIAMKHCAYVHFKDFAKAPDASYPWGYKIVPAVIGEGDVDIPACVKIMRDNGYAGFVALEYEADEDERTAVPRSLAYMKKVLG